MRKSELKNRDRSEEVEENKQIINVLKKIFIENFDSAVDEALRKSDRSEEASKCCGEENKQIIKNVLQNISTKNFDYSFKIILTLKIDSMATLEAFVNEIFEKAITEKELATSCAILCVRVDMVIKNSDLRWPNKPFGNFRSALLDKTEKEFMHISNAKEKQLVALRAKTDGQYEKTLGMITLTDEEEHKIDSRSVGIVRFVGELFNNSVLTVKIINTCFEKLLKDSNDEDMLECLCVLFVTVGKNLERRKSSLASVTQRMQNIASQSQTSKLSERVRNELQEAIKLRENNWQTSTRK